MNFSIAGYLLLFSLLGSSLKAAERPDVLVADFEAKDYGEWTAKGEAFGPGPAEGTLPNQMPVTGFLGKRLANSFYGGDKSTGTLTSPAFTIKRRNINFLIGGGNHPGETCINLLIDGKVARTATGPNDRPGGSEELDWQHWDVRDLEGKQAVIEIVDRHTGGWGHINIDHIVQSDVAKKPEGMQERVIEISSRFLLFPVTTGAPKRIVRVNDGGNILDEFEIELADKEPGFWTFIDVSRFRGKKLSIASKLPSESKLLDAIAQGDEIKSDAKLYQEKHRPQFHFTSRRGWLNDPNGLVFSGDQYHLFYQHNPFGWNWGNMHWGHAVSKDLVHWRELPIALYPKKYGDWAFSGSAVVDRENRSGFQSDPKNPPLVAAFTSTGRGECIVFSNDHGETWQEYSGNPVVKHAGRDPRLLWHDNSKQWVMAVYDEFEGKQWIAFYTSPDLKKWQFESRIEDYFECPDLFELPIDGKKEKTKWVLYAADGKYALGSFDGKTFKAESAKQTLWHGQFYAAQTFSNTPDGRRIQIGWGNGITFPGMPFNQQMTVPCLLTLRTTPAGVRLFAEPVKELDALHGKEHSWTDVLLKANGKPLELMRGDLFDIRADFVLGDATAFGFSIGGVPVVVDVAKQTITCKGIVAPVKPIDGRLRLRLLVDRGSIELFANDGEVALSCGTILSESNKSIEVYSRGGATTLKSLVVYEMKSAWER